MKIKYQCSNCGQKYQTSAMMGVGHGMYFSGVRAVGDAVYCEDCVKTWKKRNGAEFDEQYKNSWKMFVTWWNRQVAEQAAAEGKELKSARLNSHGDYEECEARG